MIALHFVGEIPIQAWCFDAALNAAFEARQFFMTYEAAVIFYL